jgi:hypothetical protein
MSQISHIIVHCSDSEFGSAALIRSWHLARGWRDIGYHKVVLNGRRHAGEYSAHDDGLIEPGRPLDGDNFIGPEEVGAHCLGYNARSIGICCIGKTEFSNPQALALIELLIELREQHKIPVERILGHCETESGRAEGKTCPNMDMDWLRRKVAR